MGRAAAYAMEVGVDAIWERDRMLAENLRETLAGVGGVAVRDIGSVRGAIVTFTVDGYEAATVKAALADRSINVSIVTPNAARYDMEARGLPDLVRASVHYYNTDAEIDRLVAAVTSL
jgi:selenocysteine lyase/cysteine desulfurase